MACCMGIHLTKMLIAYLHFSWGFTSFHQKVYRILFCIESIFATLSTDFNNLVFLLEVNIVYQLSMSEYRYVSFSV